MMNIFLEYALAFLLSIGTLFTFIWLCLLRNRLRIKWYIALPIAICHTLYGVLTVTVFAFLETGFDTDRLGNMSLFGGVFFMPLAYWLGAKLSRRKTAEVFDIFTICMLFTLMCARINCILSGCCQGLVIPGLNGFHWPTRELEILFYLVLIVLLGRKVLAGKTHGEVYPIFMIAYGIFRFIIEFFRYSTHQFGVFHIAHLWAVVTLILGLCIYSELIRKHRVSQVHTSSHRKNKRR